MFRLVVIKAAVPKFTVCDVVIEGLLVAEVPSASVLQKASVFQVPVELSNRETRISGEIFCMASYLRTTEHDE